MDMNDSLGLAIITAAKSVGAGMATIGVIGAGIGIGIIFAGYMKALALKDEHAATYLRFTFLGFALSEAMGLLAVMMAFLILFR